MADEKPPYVVTVSESTAAAEQIAFSFVPTAPQRPQTPGELPRRAPQFIVTARCIGEAVAFDWSQTPDDPREAKAALEEEVRQRIQVRRAWIKKVEQLVSDVERWGKELGWQTRRIEKRLDDLYIGKHRVPALLMQEETFRVLLEPVGRSAPGTEGIVDLYMMPAYDDIASLYFYGGQWNVHYFFNGTPATGNIHEAPGTALSRETLQRVLEEMRAHAA